MAGLVSKIEPRCSPERAVLNWALASRAQTEHTLVVSFSLWTAHTRTLAEADGAVWVFGCLCASVDPDVCMCVCVCVRMDPDVGGSNYRLFLDEQELLTKVRPPSMSSRSLKTTSL